MSLQLWKGKQIMINHTVWEKKENSLCGKNVIVEVKKKEK